jgi:bacterioferritin
MNIVTQITDAPTPRTRARTHTEKGAVTAAYSADRAAVLRMLTDSLAAELACVLRYRRHHFMARGVQSQGVAQELLAQSYVKLGHADLLIERIVQLRGVPDLASAALAGRNDVEHVEGETLESMLRANLVAERNAIDGYRDFIRCLGERDPATRRMLEGILAVEEMHADQLSDLLAAYPGCRSASYDTAAAR